MNKFDVNPIEHIVSLFDARVIGMCHKYSSFLINEFGHDIERTAPDFIKNMGISHKCESDIIACKNILLIAEYFRLKDLEQTVRITQKLLNI